MRLERLRWPLLLVSLIALGLCLCRGATPTRLAAAAVGAAGWWLLCRRKARSLDGDC
ncbi:MAG: hypothetical protein HY552_05085 [Elusimicrobia bacterium]|nr:hypothetical protein [Elusimicrobiota bacterium]